MRAGSGRLAVVVAAMLAALCLAAAGPSYMNHDAAWYLYMVDRWRDGATLYRDVVDTNPPLIIWLSTPPVLLARVMDAAAPAFFKAYVFGLAAAAIFFAGRISVRAWPQWIFPIVCTAAFACLPFVKQDFGQREHFAVLLCLPYVLMASATARFSRTESAIAGAAAGVGFALKPHFLIAFVIVEAAAVAYAGRTRLRAMAPAAVVITMAVYAAAVAIFTPEYFPVARQVSEVYGGLNSSFAALLRLREVQVWIAAAAVCAAIRWDTGSRLAPTLFAAATGFLLAALLQLKGWNYHLYPARVFLALFFVIAGTALIDRAPGLAAQLRGGVRGLAVVFAGVLIASSVRYVLEARRPTTTDLVTPLIEAIHSRAPTGPIVVLSTRSFVYPAFPAINYTRAAWGLRQNSLLFLTGLYARDPIDANGFVRVRPPSAMGATERALFDQIVDDLCRTPPRLLLIDERPAAAPASRATFDIAAYLRQSPRLAGLLDGFAAADTLGPFTVLVPDAAAACR